MFCARTGRTGVSSSAATRDHATNLVMRRMDASLEPPLAATAAEVVQYTRRHLSAPELGVLHDVLELVAAGPVEPGDFQRAGHVGARGGDLLLGAIEARRRPVGPDHLVLHLFLDDRDLVLRDVEVGILHDLVD